MSIGPFAAFAGQEIKVSEPHFRGYVPTEDEADWMCEEAAEDLHPEGELEEGWQIVAISGAIEEGEMVQSDGFIAVNPDNLAFYLCDEGTITRYDTKVDTLSVEAD